MVVMNNSYFKDSFSHRNGYSVTQPVIKKGGISIGVINAIGSCYDEFCYELNTASNTYYVPTGHYFRPSDIERELWIHFANRRLSGFNERFHSVFDEVLDSGLTKWTRILDVLEFVCKWVYVNKDDFLYLEELLRKFESSVNLEFDRLDYGYRIVNHCVVDVSSDEEVKAVEEAIAHSKDNVSFHLQSAVKHYSARPNPDVRNSIKESISAVEAVCRELTGDDTLGKALKHLEEKGVVIHRMLKEEFTKFYVYTNDADSGIRHALMDSEGTYVPTKEEAYYMLVSCSAFVNYLRRKAAR